MGKFCEKMMSEQYLHHVDIDDLAKRAKLDITPEEHDPLQRDIDNILNLFETLESIDTQAVDHVAMREVVTPDQCRTDESCGQDLHPYLVQTSAHYDADARLFMVPQVVDA